MFQENLRDLGEVCEILEVSIMLNNLDDSWRKLKAFKECSGIRFLQLLEH